MEKNQEYYEQMDRGLEDKKKILKYIAPSDKPIVILDVGVGTCALDAEILKQFPTAIIVGLEPDSENYEKRVKPFANRGHSRFSAKNKNFLEYGSDIREFHNFDYIIMSSSLHEIYSQLKFYDKYLIERHSVTKDYNPDYIVNIVGTAMVLLNNGGKLIVRDNLLPNEYDTLETLTINTMTDKGKEFATLAANSGLEGISVRSGDEETEIIGTIKDITNLTCALNWGEENFEREIQETVAYYSYKDWVTLQIYLTYFKLTNFESYEMTGYKERLSPYLSYHNFRPFPCSKAIVVFTKIE